MPFYEWFIVNLLYLQVCGLCPSGWAYTGTGCSKCPSESTLSVQRNIAIVIFAILGSVIWYFISWRPPLSAGQTGNEYDHWHKILSAISLHFDELKSKLQKVSGFRTQETREINDALLVLRKNFPPLLKMYITYFQITAAFLTFGVTWPQLLRDMMLWLKSTLFLDILALPGLSCLWLGSTFKFKLLVYTLVPLAVILLLVLPVMFYLSLGYRKDAQNNGDAKRKDKWNKVADSAWKNIMYWLFLIYSVVSLTTLQVFDCRPSGLNRLAADYNEMCPDNKSFLKIWSIIFIFIYPIGIPLFCFFAMLSMGVHLVAQDILNQELFRGLVLKYIDCTGSSASKILSLFTLDNKVDLNNPDLIKKLYNFLHENGSSNDDSIESSIFEKSDVDAKVVQEYVRRNAACYEGITLQDFESMLHDSAHTADLLSNIDGGKITKNQAIVLLMFDWKPEVLTKVSKGMNLKDAWQKMQGTGETLKSFDVEMKKLDICRCKRKYLSTQDPVLLGKHLLKLARKLRDDNLITARDIAWDESTKKENMIPTPKIDSHDVNQNLEIYSVHPDITDISQWESLVWFESILANIRIIFCKFLGSLVYPKSLTQRSFQYSDCFPNDWKCAKLRKRLQQRAISRIGFIFESYKVKFWYWELLDMLRRYVIFPTPCLKATWSQIMPSGF